MGFHTYAESPTGNAYNSLLRFIVHIGSVTTPPRNKEAIELREPFSEQTFKFKPSRILSLATQDSRLLPNIAVLEPNPKINLLEESDPVDADAIFLLEQAPPVSPVAAIPGGVCDENAVVECHKFDKNCELHDDDDVCEVIVGDKGGDVGDVGTDDELRLDREEP
uniref:Uncharacterized protein n=1 Tax=Glossina austeni TaxID=7395 RepID=A0A1A9VI44_GLOAU